MGLYDDQIKSRIRADDASFSEAFAAMADSILGGHSVLAGLKSEEANAKDALDEILHWYGVKPREIPNGITGLNEQMDYQLRPEGIMYRQVKLVKGWHRDSMGAMLSRTRENGSGGGGKVVALLPNGYSGYTYFDYETRKKVKVSSKTEHTIAEEAVCFYRPLPQKKLGVKDMLLFVIRSLDTADFVYMLLVTLTAALIGLLPAALNKYIFSSVIASNDTGLVLPVALMLLCVTISLTLIGITKNLILARIGTKVSTMSQAAAMSRMLSLPAGFFQEYSAGELSSRVSTVAELCDSVVGAALSTGLTSVFSLIYIGQIFSYAPGLFLPAIAVILSTVIVSTVTTFAQMKNSQKEMECSAEESGLEFALISGIQKIKLANAEKRVFAKWGRMYAEHARLLYSPPMFLRISSVFTTAVSLAGTILIYFIAVKTGVTLSEYMAFSISYGLVSGAFVSLFSIAMTVANIKPFLEMARPILETVPEIAADKQIVTRLSGGVELSNVSFRYNEEMPLILSDLSLKIRPGQYVAIVGRTGCGKSTLMRLMLGFETPQRGAIYFDGKDAQVLDMPSLRRHIGVVLQNGKLFSGDIYSNLVVSAPWLTVEDAWEAAKQAGIADDIRSMPMGMHTLITEGGGGISGGQRQRLMIARAIAAKPKMLMFDEATSALDNIAQKQVSDALAALKCTRIVIAHRLSTIRHCDRILVLEGGKVVEDGTYNELIARNGLFTALVSRQQVESLTEC